MDRAYPQQAIRTKDRDFGRNPYQLSSTKGSAGKEMLPEDLPRDEKDLGGGSRQQGSPVPLGWRSRGTASRATWGVEEQEPVNPAGPQAADRGSAAAQGSRGVASRATRGAGKQEPANPASPRAVGRGSTTA